ncbi:hypothetical protein T492DRAFT_868783, partial [Pavlovales sp. CCMP2436]
IYVGQGEGREMAWFAPAPVPEAAAEAATHVELRQDLMQRALFGISASPSKAGASGVFPPRVALATLRLTSLAHFAAASSSAGGGDGEGAPLGAGGTGGVHFHAVRYAPLCEELDGGLLAPPAALVVSRVLARLGERGVDLRGRKGEALCDACVAPVGGEGARRRLADAALADAAGGADGGRAAAAAAAGATGLLSAAGATAGLAGRGALISRAAVVAGGAARSAAVGAAVGAGLAGFAASVGGALLVGRALPDNASLPAAERAQRTRARLGSRVGGTTASLGAAAVAVLAVEGGGVAVSAAAVGAAVAVAAAVPFVAAVGLGGLVYAGTRAFDSARARSRAALLRRVAARTAEATVDAEGAARALSVLCAKVLACATAPLAAVPREQAAAAVRVLLGDAAAAVRVRVRLRVARAAALPSPAGALAGAVGGEGGPLCVVACLAPRPGLREARARRRLAGALVVAEEVLAWAPSTPQLGAHPQWGVGAWAHFRADARELLCALAAGSSLEERQGAPASAAAAKAAAAEAEIESEAAAQCAHTARLLIAALDAYLQWEPATFSRGSARPPPGAAPPPPADVALSGGEVRSSGRLLAPYVDYGLALAQAIAADWHEPDARLRAAEALAAGELAGGSARGSLLARFRQLRARPQGPGAAGEEERADSEHWRERAEALACVCGLHDGLHVGKQ